MRRMTGSTACVAIAALGLACQREPVEFRATIVDIEPESPGHPVAGVEVAVVSNEDGRPLGQTATSDADGTVRFLLPPRTKVGFRMTRSGFMPTYRFDVRTETAGARMQIMPLPLWDSTLRDLGLVLSPETGVVAGEVLLGEEEIEGAKVGCARIESPSGGEAYYFDPKTMVHVPRDRVSQTSWRVSDFMVVGLPEGEHELRAVIGKTVIGSRSVRVFAGAITFAILLHPYGDENPTPPECRPPAVQGS